MLCVHTCEECTLRWTELRRRSWLRSWCNGRRRGSVRGCANRASTPACLRSVSLPDTENTQTKHRVDMNKTTYVPVCAQRRRRRVPLTSPGPPPSAPRDPRDAPPPSGVPPPAAASPHSRLCPLASELRPGSRSQCPHPEVRRPDSEEGMRQEMKLATGGARSVLLCNLIAPSVVCVGFTSSRPSEAGLTPG